MIFFTITFISIILLRLKFKEFKFKVFFLSFLIGMIVSISYSIYNFYRNTEYTKTDTSFSDKFGKFYSDSDNGFFSFDYKFILEEQDNTQYILNLSPDNEKINIIEDSITFLRIKTYRITYKSKIEYFIFPDINFTYKQPKRFWEIHLNKKDYEIYKTYKDSLEKRNNSMEKVL